MSPPLVWLPVVRTDAVAGRCCIVACHLFAIGDAVSHGLVFTLPVLQVCTHRF